MSTRDGMNYAPTSTATPKVVEPGEFVFAAAYFDHGHIYGQIGGLAAAGGTLKYVCDPQPERLAKVLEQHPHAKAVSDFREILDDPEVKLVTAAAIPNLRCGIGLQVMEAGKHYLTDKAPFTTLDQLASARAAVEKTVMKYGVCYSERLLNESGYYAGELVRNGAIGRVLQVLNLAPHNLAASSRPEWFFRKENYGGILTDIGSHQFEQFLTFTGSKDATVNHARVENFANPEFPELEDFGEAQLTTDTGASCYCRLDWFNPAASRTWGDGRTFILGTEGYIEIRKYVDVCNGAGNKIYLVNQEVEQCIECEGKVGFPFFGSFILDILNGTETAMTQAHAFKAAELSLIAQQMADGV
ncbi:MAG: Gfo/Idh/MocA family oxidoreductase [Verrucomicrobia bacterium]|nr:Gfo/Idh/MocA family oxidoreductase [Verrucomicrobiota bacterium]MCH8513753.1 Gfo/Idh/MocA family oxidoreductase [Kiritimatiellia bacterium]